LKSKHASFPFVLMAECGNSYSALRVGLRRAKPFTDLLHVEVLSLECGAGFGVCEVIKDLAVHGVILGCSGLVLT